MTEKSLKIDVRGMNCEGCANNVSNALKSVKGVQRTEIDLVKGRATIWLDDQSNDQKAIEDQIRKAITKAGYLVADIH